MDYEKAYKRIVAKIKVAYFNALTDSTKNVLVDILPELAESEDERIRDEIISALKFANVGGVYDEHIAYLEKQKEHSMSAEEVLTRAGLKPYKDGNQWCILAGDNIQEGICGFGDTIDEALYQFLIDVLEKQKEQKPVELSPDDYKRIPNELISLCNDIIAGRQLLSVDKNGAARLRAWLKELNDAQKPAEWSEEDEIHLKNAILAAEKEWGIDSCTANFLKSIHSRPKSSDNWKPSDGLKMPKWRKAKKGTALPGDSVVRSPGEDPRLGKVAVRDCEYITVNELNSLPVED